MPETSLISEIDEIVKRAQKQPGITELFMIYDQYEDVLRQASKYLYEARSKVVFSTTDGSQ